MKVSQIDLYLEKESKWEDTDKEIVRSCNKSKGGICAKEGEGISVVKGREREKVYEFIEEQAYWVLYLLRFNFTFKHVPGTKIVTADRLSRRLNWKIGVEKDNENRH